MMAAIDEFLKTARLGEIATGISKEDVRGLLGDPEDVSVQKNPEIWKYGALQLTFYKDSQESEPHLAAINLYFNNPKDPIPAALSLTGWLPTGETSVQDFRDHLTDADLQVDFRAPSASHDHVVLPSGVRVTFDEGRLHSVHYSAKHEREVKQLTVSIPRKDLEILRKEAASRRISMSALCSEWIKEHISNLQKIGSS
jgi:hypothetical protein